MNNKNLANLLIHIQFIKEKGKPYKKIIQIYLKRVKLLKEREIVRKIG